MTLLLWLLLILVVTAGVAADHITRAGGLSPAPVLVSYPVYNDDAALLQELLDRKAGW